jgi:hypothetical protein
MATKKTGAKAAKTPLLPPAPRLAEARITVDYSVPLEGMIAAASLVWASPVFVRPPWVVNGAGRSEFAVSTAEFSADLSSRDVASALDAAGLRPATLAELLAFAANDAGRASAVVALGSANVGGTIWNPPVPVLSRGRLVQGGWNAPWLAGTRFLAVSKDAASGLGKIAHNHLLVPGPKLRAPQWDFAPPAIAVFPLVIDAKAARTALLKAGKYRDRLPEVEAAVTASTAAPIRDGNVEARLVHFNREIAEEEIGEELAARSLVPAGTFELLCFGAQHPEVQRERQIVAAGEAIGGLFYQLTTIEGRTIMLARGAADPAFTFAQSFLAVPVRT